MFLEFVEPNQKIACIGMSKLFDKNLITLCQTIGFVLANMQKQVISGNANGADNSFAEGANAFDSKMVSLYLPVKNHNMQYIKTGNKIFYEEDNPEWGIIAKEHHNYYDNLSDYVKKLFNRNVGIILNSDSVIALPDMGKKQLGGTGHSMRIAKTYQKPILNISEVDISKEIKKLAKEFIK